MSDDSFVFTDEMVRVSNQLWMVTSAVGACMCFLVLIVIGFVALHPPSRRQLDRVSFRIVVYALVANMIFGIVNAIGGSFTGPSWTCGLTIWILQLTLELASFLTFCIALNLQLVVVHRVNGQRMEKFYVIGSCIISLCITIPPYAAGQYGWDPLVQDCWYSSDDPKGRLAWQIGSQLLWTLLTVVGEVAASLTVFIFMIRHQLRSKKIMLSNSTVRSRSAGTASKISKSSLRNQRIMHANMYRTVLIRIAMYPIVSCIINLTSVMCVIHATVTDGVHNMDQYRIALTSDFLYGARAIFYALLAASDPSLLSAIKTLMYGEGGRSSFFSSSQTTMPHFASWQLRSKASNPTRSRRGVHVELSTIHHFDDVDEEISVTETAPPKNQDGKPAAAAVSFANLPLGDRKAALDTQNEANQRSATSSHIDFSDDSEEMQMQEDSFRRQI
ncbi:hypothetical protein K435DRAFT_728241 [Dendrothele bispora CBS 962.96]|uniref:G-protein coupled receptors family 2 profile 2 domain-containing protein n=1 Tax=Dendrothele bispora (strain CBS 962.96) TaxID=1314807 RepID=A0A4S8LMQ5_DENBC|nr:hypothetical protein K435DRAFT_728241 [Dendrothele bispora CBS 962.96]